MAEPLAYLLAGSVQNYVWGSPSWVPEMMGVEPTGEPVAEVWFGAHPKAPTTVVESPDDSLADLIARDPVHHLGSASVDRFGPTLPYLVKLLAAAEPLSIQLHPSREQARHGCAREDAAGVDRLAPNRSFRDNNHKPEMIVAISRFEALVGLRPVNETLMFLGSLSVPALDDLVAQIDKSGLAAALETILTMAPEKAAAMVAAAVEACRSTSDSSPWIAEAELLVRLNQKYPADRGVLTAALLNRIVLGPGEAIFLNAGNLHAYVEGFGVEIMANSDNVLRGGLTPKHIDVAALLDIVDATPIVPEVQPADRSVTNYITPVPEFTVTRYVTPQREACPASGPRIVLAVGGAARVTVDGQSLEVPAAGAAWIPAAADPVQLDGSADVFVAHLNL